MHVEIRFIQHLMRLVRRGIGIVPVLTLLLFPVTCDASPFPHSVFVDPAGAGHEHHQHAQQPATIAIDHSEHLGDAADQSGHATHQSEAARDATTTDLQSLTSLTGAMDGFLILSLPPLHVPITAGAGPTSVGQEMATPLVGTTTTPPSPPPRT